MNALINVYLKRKKTVKYDNNRQTFVIIFWKKNAQIRHWHQHNIQRLFIFEFTSQSTISLFNTILNYYFFSTLKITSYDSAIQTQYLLLERIELMEEISSNTVSCRFRFDIRFELINIQTIRLVISIFVNLIVFLWLRKKQQQQKQRHQPRHQ